MFFCCICTTPFKPETRFFCRQACLPMPFFSDARENKQPQRFFLIMPFGWHALKKHQKHLQVFVAALNAFQRFKVLDGNPTFCSFSITSPNRPFIRLFCNTAHIVPMLPNSEAAERALPPVAQIFHFHLAVWANNLAFFLQDLFARVRIVVGWRRFCFFVIVSHL